MGLDIGLPLSATQLNEKVAQLPLNLSSMGYIKSISLKSIEDSVSYSEVLCKLEGATVTFYIGNIN